MTERQPDDLYDALRNRLEDYGQEPPAQLWAGIRAKLPPPVAQPQLRRRRRWSPALLLCLLLTVAGAVGWNLWQKNEQGSPAGKQSQVATSNNNSNKTNTADRGNEPGSATNSLALSTAGSTVATAEQSGSAPVPGTAIAQQASAAKALNSAVAGTDAVVAKASSRSRKSRIESRRSRSYAVTFGRRERATRLERTATPFSKTDPSLGSSDGQRANETDVRTSSADNKSPEAAGEISRAAAGPVVASSQTESAAAAGSGQAAGVTRPSDVAHPAEATGVGAGSAVAAAGVGGASTSQLALRAVPLAVGTYPQPVVRVLPDSARPLPAVAARRWAALVLAGPALTHRLLYSGSKDYAAPYPLPNNVPTADFATRDANSVAQDEKPALGFGVQVQVRRVLTGRWAVSSGLGYQEYATRTTTTQAATYYLLNGSQTGTFAPVPYVRQAPPVQFTHRDTYRFLTVPVRFSYALGHPAGRFRYALLAGADAALYLGGSSPGPNGRIQTWDVANSPYRSLSASFSAGLEFRYRVASHWDVLAQPTASYFLNALPRPATGLTPRYLLGTGAQLGVSYDFR